ncbi:MAG: InlB B-repeat-containing protein, partial [Lachnospiraceae bacterium]|nr:InlB B-repeat-containing protein [Lachnospiraceae bacterium]
MITKAERMRDEWKSGKGGNRAKVGSVQYNTIFYAPVLEEVKKREATLDLNGGSWVTSGRSNTIKFSNFGTTSLPGASDVKRTGYTFDGWYTAKNGGNKITSLGSPEVEDGITTLYAHWTVKKYNIVIKNRIVKVNTLDVSNGVPSLSEKSYGNEKDLKTYSNVSYESEIQLPAKYDLEGFNFIGFNQNKSSLTKSWDGNAKIKVSALTVNESGTTYIYPIYKEKQASVLLSGSEVTASDKTKKTSNYSTTVTFNYYGGLELPTPAEFTGFNFDY